MDAPLSNYAKVYINGTLMGLYSSSESISKKFLNKYFYSKDNTFIKCNPPDGAGPQTTNLPNLKYLGQDSNSYYSAYEMKSDYGWKELINLCDTLSNSTSEIEKILDVDRVLWMLAFNNVLVNLDSYIGGFAQNYYLYRDDNKRFVPVIWDLNESFGSFSSTGTGNLNSTTSKQQMSNMLNVNSTSYPLLNKLLAVPLYKRMYLAHCKTIVKENFENNSYYTKGQSLQATIDAAVQQDQNKFYTYANFLSNINTDISSGGGPMASTTPGITNLMNARSTYILALSDYTVTQATISNISLSNSSPDLNETITVLADITDETAVFLGYRNDITKNFVRVSMFDDGAHGDGAANDGVYGADMLVSSNEMQYYIYAENATIGTFSPARAEHEYYTLKVTRDIKELVINEFMASNDSAIADETDSYEDWIEIYNTTSDSIFLGDYYLSDDMTDPTLYNFPAEYIPAFGFKLVWASKNTDISADHADFKLSASGEQIGLFKMNGTAIDTIDYILFSTQTTDVSYGREYDASPNWIFFTTSTPRATNQQTNVGVETLEIKTTGLAVYPNPFQDKLKFENPTNSKAVITIYSSLGQVLDQFEVSGNNTTEWMDSYAAGIRLVHIATDVTSETIRVVKQ